MQATRLTREFYARDVLDVAPALVGKVLVISDGGDTCRQYIITETEAYRGSEDLACHACRGRTGRTEIMYHAGGHLYVYFIYGMYWMLNVVAEKENVPQAALIRGLHGISGPGRLTRAIGINKSFYGEDLVTSVRIWIEDHGIEPEIETGPRIGINYAGDYWKERPWRYLMKSS